MHVEIGWRGLSDADISCLNQFPRYTLIERAALVRGLARILCYIPEEFDQLL
jgi:hypothetical protein